MIAMARASLAACACAAAAWAVSPARAADIGYGTLAPGATSQSDMTGVRAEICRDHLVVPAFAKVRLPPGIRLVTAAEAAKTDAGLASLLAKEPGLGSHFVGSLCFLSVESFVVDGRRAHSAGTTPLAFWWARAAREAEAKADPRARGALQWVQLASWYDRSVDRARVLVTDPMAQFVDLEVTPIDADRWRLRLALPGEVVGAEVRVSGDRVARKATKPGYMTVPFTGGSAGVFTVFTYFGHHHRKAEGTWEARGSGAFSTAFAIAGESAALGTMFQDGWQARSGLYSLEPAGAARDGSAGEERRPSATPSR